jgi:NADH-quinone oxidoreductase subunit G
MAKMVKLTIDGQEVNVPAGTLIVDAAKQIGNDIPVFCYHPKMEPVGMCRMCLVSIGRPAVDRATNQPVLNEDGTPKISFGPKLETACTTPVSEGMVVVTSSDVVEAARKDVLEFLLTSHPLDCPICDKGGECPLQNLTLRYGPGKSRFILDEKMRLAKHYPLGELIFLDRERCIQCARCIRFQNEIADDPVIGFAERGRSLEIITDSDPGFDSYFSGNTTDICPVGALTTADFRFNARPWEMRSPASICNQCPVGCNLTINVRREASSGGNAVVKRIMPRQNEGVNEIWICDKGRFAYHYIESENRIYKPLARKNGELVEVEWDEALDLAAAKIKEAGAGLVTLAGGRLANEDLFNLHALTQAQGGQAVLDSDMAGGEVVAQLNPPAGSNLKDMGPGSAILVIACDLEEEAPVWYLRVRQAAKRGATLIVANPRETKLDRATKLSFRYKYGQAAQMVGRFRTAVGAETPAPAGTEIAPEADPFAEASAALAKAQNLVVIYGSEGLDLNESRALVDACADLLKTSGHTGRPNNGLVAAWTKGNLQGAWDMGFRPADDLTVVLGGAKTAYVAAADPAGDDPVLVKALDSAGFVIVQELLMTPTARAADLVLPALPFTEREGTYTSGERIVQRFYPAVTLRADPGQPRPMADFAIAGCIGERLGLDLEHRFASLIFERLSASASGYAGLSYPKLSEVAPQWPVVGNSNLYFGGTTYKNEQGLGARLVPTGAEEEGQPFQAVTAPAENQEPGVIRAYPITRLYDLGTLTVSTKLLHLRLAKPEIWVHPDTARGFGLTPGEPVGLDVDGTVVEAGLRTDESVPVGVALVPRSVGIPIRKEYRVVSG